MQEYGWSFLASSYYSYAILQLIPIPMCFCLRKEIIIRNHISKLENTALHSVNVEKEFLLLLYVADMVIVCYHYIIVSLFQYDKTDSGENKNVLFNYTEIAKLKVCPHTHILKCDFLLLVVPFRFRIRFWSGNLTKSVWILGLRRTKVSKPQR